MRSKNSISIAILIMFSFMCIFTTPAFGVETRPSASQVLVTDNASECAGESIDQYTVVEYKNISDVMSNLNQGNPYIDGVQLNQYTPARTTGINYNNHAVLGCGPTAMGAVENYHLQPDGYNLAHRNVNNDLAQLLADHGKVSEWFPQIVPGTPNINYFQSDGTGCMWYIVDDVLGAFGYDVEIIDVWKKYNDWQSRANGLYNMVKSEINAGRPVMLGLNAAMGTGNPNHYVVITGYKKAVPPLKLQLAGIKEPKLFLYVLKGWGTNREYDSNGNFVRYVYDQGYKNEWWQVNAKKALTSFNFFRLRTETEIVETYDMKNVLLYKIKPVSRNSDTMFVDLNSNHWAYPYLSQLYYNQKISGYLLNGQRYFLPDASILRKDALFLIMKGADISTPSRGSTEYNNAVAEAKKFKDLKNSTDELALVYIGTAVKNNLIDGYSYWTNQNFNPKVDITRSDFAKLLVLAAEKKNHAFIASRKYSGSYSGKEQYLVKLYNAQIIDGYDTGSVPQLRGEGSISRAEAAKILTKTFYYSKLQFDWRNA